MRKQKDQCVALFHCVFAPFMCLKKDEFLHFFTFFSYMINIDLFVFDF